MKKYSNIIFLGLIILVSCFNLRYIFQPGLFRAHDIENHLARVANYYLAIKDGHFPVRWARNLNFKFGYPVFNYNYPLANILCYPLIVIGLSIEESLKIVLFLAYLGSGIFMYLWLRKLFNSVAGLVGAILYLCAPYQFLDLYVRGVVGENLSFALLPAILYFITVLTEKPNKLKFLLLVLGTFMFSLSHNIMVMIIGPLIILYLIYITRKNSSFWFTNALKAVLLGFLLSSFFWIPAILEAKYVTLEAFNYKTVFLDHFVNIKQLFYGPWQNGYSVKGPDDTMSFQLGLGQWLVLVISGILLFKFKRSKKDSIGLLSITGLIICGLAIFLMLPISRLLWNIIPILGYMQYPWRLLSILIIVTAFLGAIITKYNKYIGLAILVVSLIYCQQFTKPFAWDKKPDMEYYDFLFTTSVLHENKPRWFEEGKTDQLQTRFTSLSGAVGFRELLWKTGLHRYEIDSPNDTNIIEHTAYFPGWQARIDGKVANIAFNDKNYPGLIMISIPAGRHLIETKFTENTSARIIGDCLSIVAILLIGLVLIKKVD